MSVIRCSFGGIASFVMMCQKKEETIAVAYKHFVFCWSASFNSYHILTRRFS